MYRLQMTTRVLAACGAIALVLSAQSAMAQSTIFNIPSTDTVDKGKAYVEFDSLPQAPGPAEGSMFVISNPRLVVGLPNNAEVGVNFPIYHNSGTSPSSLGYIQPNLKWKFYKNDDMGLASDVGVVVNVPLNSRDAQATWSYIYAGISKKMKGDHGARVTIGPYGVIANADPTSGPVSFGGKRGGVLAGYEQPLTKTISFVADWFSTQNTLGYFTPGVSITLPKNGLFNIGYSIGNDAWANETPAYRDRYLFIYYGVTF